jgi:hypothetical protein
VAREPSATMNDLLRQDRVGNSKRDLPSGAAEGGRAMVRCETNVEMPGRAGSRGNIEQTAAAEAYYPLW